MHKLTVETPYYLSEEVTFNLIELREPFTLIKCYDTMSIQKGTPLFVWRLVRKWFSESHLISGGFLSPYVLNIRSQELRRIFQPELNQIK